LEIDEGWRDAPAPFTLKYVEYARTATDRQSSYDKDQSQSWLATLVRNACTLLFPECRFRLETNVVAYCCSLDECRFGEELFTRTTHAYYHTGMGLCVASAGGSNNSSNLGISTLDEALEKWAKTDKFREEIMPYLATNMKWENSKLAGFRAYKASLVEDADSAYAAVRAERERKDKFIAEAGTRAAKRAAEVDAATQAHNKKWGKFIGGPEGSLQDGIDE
jgi:hypothetical protein